MFIETHKQLWWSGLVLFIFSWSSQRRSSHRRALTKSQNLLVRQLPATSFVRMVDTLVPPEVRAANCRLVNGVAVPFPTPSAVKIAFIAVLKTQCATQFMENVSGELTNRFRGKRNWNQEKWTQPSPITTSFATNLVPVPMAPLAASWHQARGAAAQFRMRFAAPITSIVVRLEPSVTRLTEDAPSRTDVDLPLDPVFPQRFSWQSLSPRQVTKLLFALIKRATVRMEKPAALCRPVAMAAVPCREPTVAATTFTVAPTVLPAILNIPLVVKRVSMIKMTNSLPWWPSLLPPPSQL